MMKHHLSTRMMKIKPISFFYSFIFSLSFNMILTRVIASFMDKTSHWWSWLSCDYLEKEGGCSYHDSSWVCILFCWTKAGSCSGSTLLHGDLWGCTCILCKGVPDLVSTSLIVTHDAWRVINHLVSRRKSLGAWTMQRRLKQLVRRKKKETQFSKWVNM